MEIAGNTIRVYFVTFIFIPMEKKLFSYQQNFQVFDKLVFHYYGKILILKTFTLLKNLNVFRLLLYSNAKMSEVDFFAK